MHFFDDIVDRELAALLRYAREECNLKEKIAKLFTQRVGPSLACLFQGIERFVSFFQQHRRERGVGLLAIPRTAIGRAQSIHQLNQISKSLRHEN